MDLGNRIDSRRCRSFGKTIFLIREDYLLDCLRLLRALLTSNDAKQLLALLGSWGRTFIIGHRRDGPAEPSERSLAQVQQPSHASPPRCASTR
jgi:hypothetical protein